MIDIQKAKRKAVEYCEANGFSVNKLKESVCSYNESMHFLSLPITKAQGLLNDIETQGVPILVVNKDYTVSETEHTRLYFRNQH